MLRSLKTADSLNGKTRLFTMRHIRFSRISRRSRRYTLSSIYTLQCQLVRGSRVSLVSNILLFGDKHRKRKKVQVCFPFSLHCVIMSEIKKAFLSDNLGGVSLEYGRAFYLQIGSFFESVQPQNFLPIVSEYRDRVNSHQFLALRVSPQKMGNFHSLQTVPVQQLSETNITRGDIVTAELTI